MLYMMPLGAGVSKAKANWAGWGDPDESFWCCYGTGIESFAKLADGAFFEEPSPPSALGALPATATAVRRSNATAGTTTAPPGGSTGGGDAREASAPAPAALWVSQFVPSTVWWEAGEASVTLRRDLDGESCTQMIVHLALARGRAPPGEAEGGQGGGAAEGSHEGRPGGKEAEGSIGGHGKMSPSAQGGCFSPAGCTLWLRLPSWADPEASVVELIMANASRATTLEPSAGRAQMTIGRFLKIERSWAAGDALRAVFGLYAYLEPLNDWRPQYESTFALLYGPYMLVGLTETGEQVLQGSPREVRQWTNVTHCLPDREDGGTDGGSSTTAAYSRLGLAAPGANGARVRLRPLSSVVDEAYTAYFLLR